MLHSQPHVKHRRLTLSLLSLAFSHFSRLIGLTILESQLGHIGFSPLRHRKLAPT